MYFINYIKALQEAGSQVLEPPLEEIPVIYQSKTISRSVFDGARYIYKLPPDLDEKMKEGSIRARLGYQTFEETEPGAPSTRISAILITDNDQQSHS
jgi:hypothetical protein